MLQSIWDDVRREFSFGNMINRIIIVNVAVFLFVSIVWMIFTVAAGHTQSPAFDSLMHWFYASSDWKRVLLRPWTMITYMFLHQGFFHLLWNMLYLFWFGRIFGDLLGDRRVLPLYLLGGFAGFLFYFIAFNVGSFGAGGSYLLGASGAVYCILTATAIFAPDYNIRLFIIGNVRLKYIVFFAIMMQLIGLGSLDNIGGTFAHIGGIIMGILFAFYLRRGTDLTEPVQNLLAWIQKKWANLLAPSKEHKQPGPRAAYRSGRSVKETAGPKKRPSFMRKAGETAPRAKPASNTSARSQMTHQEELDAILDKIKERGYNSLTKEEKDFLFRASNQK
ncbi:rhomboid family intramembrane serine protease [Neolewinella aurantiaca]|uniref:Rhomboid family intramembrane serine protease n=1 Tax=Neolewinella aurantiaca TaxID=2602767 RepID=A0A5C7FGF4_9BACT|nr:rhomboid family intramembrane serine protease [Neolewinella aurantiaca]TXF88712.1 rhomboid family intramembrane serine protease [Neolewinella aurantiaca]